MLDSLSCRPQTAAERDQIHRHWRRDCAKPCMATTMTATQDVIKASIFQRLHPRVYFEHFISENVRPDRRNFDAWRDVSTNVGMSTHASLWSSPIEVTPSSGSISTADGSALVRLGDTTIVCGVKAEIAEPELDHPEEGFLGEQHQNITSSIYQFASM